MATATATREKPTNAAPAETPAPAKGGQNVPRISAERLPYHPAIEERFGIDRASWRALVEAVFPLAQSVDSVLMALSYCRARKLDPFKRVVHIVPIYDSNKRRMVDTVWPGIGELRTTAFRTGQFAGREATVYGPDVTRTIGRVEITFPEWAQVTVYRMLQGQRVAFAGPQVCWIETYAQAKRDDPTPNSMWSKRPRGQLDKCAEAAALRAAFPEEVGNEYCAEEAHSIVIGETAPQRKLSGSRTDQVAELLDDGDGGHPGDSLGQSLMERITEAETGEELHSIRSELEEAIRQDMLPSVMVGHLQDELEIREKQISCGENSDGELTSEARSESESTESTPASLTVRDGEKFADWHFRALEAIREATCDDDLMDINAAIEALPEGYLPPGRRRSLDEAMSSRTQEMAASE